MGDCHQKPVLPHPDAVIPTLAVASHSFWSHSFDFVPLLAALVVGGILWYIYPKFTKQQYIKRVIQIMSDGKETLEPRTITLELESDKVRSSSEQGEGSINWSAITGVVQIDEHILFLMEAANAIIIPKRAFTDREAVLRFFELSNTYFTNNQSKS